MPYDEDGDLWYPSTDDVLMIHRDIVEEDPEASAGVRNPDRIDFALSFVRDGYFGEVPETIHEKAFHLMRLVASNHWFVDGNKRTALNVTELFYAVNGYQFEYGEDVRSMLKLFSVREALIDRNAGPQYLADRTDATDPSSADVRRALVTVVVAALAQRTGTDLEELLPDDADLPSARRQFGLTTEYDGTVNNDEAERTDTNGG